MNWLRIAVWVIAVFCAALLVAMGASALFGARAVIPLGAIQLRVSTVAIFATSTLLYFLFAKPLLRQRLLQVLVVFLLIEAIDGGIPLLLGASWGDVLEWPSTARHLAAALLGLLLANLLARAPRREGIVSARDTR